MEAGPELDKLIAEHVMGYTQKPHPYGGKCWHNGKEFVSFGRQGYSTTWEGMREVVEKLDGMFSVGRVGGKWRASFSDTSPIRPMPSLAKGDTAPHAICLAALKAVGHQLEATA